jgi:hypothetical protein
MGFFDTGRVENGDDITGQQILAIGVISDWRVRGRISPRIRNYTSKGARKVANLIVPAAGIAGKFMEKDNRSTSTHLVIMEAHSNSGRVGHVSLERRFSIRMISHQSAGEIEREILPPLFHHWHEVTACSKAENFNVAARKRPLSELE